MPLINGGGGGGGTPFNGGTITNRLIEATSDDPGLIVRVPSASVNFAVAVQDSSNSNSTVTVLDPFGGVSCAGLFVSATEDQTIASFDAGAQALTHNIIRITGGGGIYGRFNQSGYFITKKTAAPADAELVANECALWFDSTDGAAKFMLKGKSADGTVVSAAIALS